MNIRFVTYKFPNEPDAVPDISSPKKKKMKKKLVDDVYNVILFMF